MEIDWTLATASLDVSGAPRRHEGRGVETQSDHRPSIRPCVVARRVTVRTSSPPVHPGADSKGHGPRHLRTSPSGIEAQLTSAFHRLAGGGKGPRRRRKGTAKEDLRDPRVEDRHGRAQ